MDIGFFSKFPLPLKLSTAPSDKSIIPLSDPIPHLLFRKAKTSGDYEKEEKVSLIPPLTGHCVSRRKDIKDYHSREASI